MKNSLSEGWDMGLNHITDDYIMYTFHCIRTTPPPLPFGAGNSTLESGQPQAVSKRPVMPPS